MSREDAARILGMKVSEVVSVDVVGGRLVATTHDGQATDVGAAPEPAPVEEAPDLDDEDDVDGGPGGEVPDATADVVLAWVDGDAERAGRAHGHEMRRERPRKTLVAELVKLKG